MFSISKKSKRKEVDSALTPSLPRLSTTNQQGNEKNSLPPTTQWNYSSRSSSISTEGGSVNASNKCKVPYIIYLSLENHNSL